jgi:hypothetical protein
VYLRVRTESRRDYNLNRRPGRKSFSGARETPRVVPIKFLGGSETLPPSAASARSPQKPSHSGEEFRPLPRALRSAATSPLFPMARAWRCGRGGSRIGGGGSPPRPPVLRSKGARLHAGRRVGRRAMGRAMGMASSFPAARAACCFRRAPTAMTRTTHRRFPSPAGTTRRRRWWSSSLPLLLPVLSRA